MSSEQSSKPLISDPHPSSSQRVAMEQPGCSSSSEKLSSCPPQQPVAVEGGAISTCTNTTSVEENLQPPLSATGGGSRTRETVQKVYQMIEKHKQATSSDHQFETSLYFDFDAPTQTTSGRNASAGSGSSGPRNSGGSNNATTRSQQQQQQRGTRGSNRNNYQNSRSRSGTSLASSDSANSGGPNARRNSSVDVASGGTGTGGGPENANNNETETGEGEEETQELAQLRCPSVRTEVISEREKRRRNRCSDYPGFAFGFGSVFGSDTMMKFSIIRNELDNVTKVQLKRVRLLHFSL
jgi:hypothetical protein